MRAVGERIGTNAELGLVGWREQQLLLADRPALDFGFVEPWHLQLADAIRWQEARPDQAASNQRWIFILADAMAPCIDRTRAHYVGHANRRKWWLFRADAVAPECRGGKVPGPSGEDSNDPNSD
jgi:hypothetical protein